MAVHETVDFIGGSISSLNGGRGLHYRERRGGLSRHSSGRWQEGSEWNNPQIHF
jgi:hypothetical protein